MGPIAVVERDYTAIADKWAASGRWSTGWGSPPRASPTIPDVEVADLARQDGVMLAAPATAARRSTPTSKMAEAILALSGTTNGRLAVQGFRELETPHRPPLADLAEGSEEKRITFADTQAGPVPVITSPEWSGSETGGRRYAPFTVNVEGLKPWHTLTGPDALLSSTTTGSRSSASRCRSTGRRWTCTAVRRARARPDRRIG